MSHWYFGHPTLNRTCTAKLVRREYSAFCPIASSHRDSALNVPLFFFGFFFFGFFFFWGVFHHLVVTLPLKISAFGFLSLFFLFFIPSKKNKIETKILFELCFS